MVYARKRARRRFTRKKAYRRSRRRMSVRSRRPKRRSMALGERTLSRTVKLRFAKVANIAAGAAPGLNTLLPVLRANGPYDPELAVGGNSTFDWTRYQNLYNKYVVLGSKCTYWITPNNPANLSIAGAIRLDDDGTAFSAFPDWFRWTGDPRFKFKIAMSGPTVMRNSMKLSTTYSAKKYFNCGSVKDRDDLHSATNSTPLQEAFFNGAIQTTDTVSTVPAMTVSIIVDYIVRFYEPKDQYNIL